MTVASSSPPSRLRRAGGATSKLKIRGAREAGDDGALAAVFIAPALLGFLVFLLWPTLRGIYLSFTRFNLLTPAEWVGLDNYDRMIRDPVFWHSLAVTVEYVAINIGVQTVAALAIAVLLQRLTRSAVLRGIVLTPYLMSNVVAGIVWLWILDTQMGIGNEILQGLGFDRVPFLADETWAIPTIALINVWRHVGYTALLLFAGLQAIHHRQERQAGRRTGLRQAPRQGLRAGHRRRGRRQRPDPVEPLHRLRGLVLHRQEAVGHEVQLRQPPLPVRRQVVLRPGEEGVPRTARGLR